MTRPLIGAAALFLLSATPALAQAWLPSQGEVTVSFVYSDSFVDEHDLSGLRYPNSNISTQSLLADVTFGLRDNLSVAVSLPVTRSRFFSQGDPPHPTSLDNGAYHSSVTDLRVDVRYNAVNRRGLVVTPYVTTVTPSHGYEYFAHSAPGRRVNELQLGASVGKTIDSVLPGMFLQGRYGYGIQERFLGFSHNRSLGSIESGYFATPDVRVFAMVSGQRTHGGVDLYPAASREWPTAQWRNHDRITRENFLNVGGGIGWAVNDDVDIYGSYTKMVAARNTHVLDRGIQVGVSLRLQQSLLERGIVNLSAGRRLARCACQKGLALRR